MSTKKQNWEKWVLAILIIVFSALCGYGLYIFNLLNNLL